jgi:hypothetical protein
MTVKEILAGGIRFYVEGSGYIPKGRFVIMKDNNSDKNIQGTIIMNNSNNTTEHLDQKK